MAPAACAAATPLGLRGRIGLESGWTLRACVVRRELTGAASGLEFDNDMRGINTSRYFILYNMNQETSYSDSPTLCIVCDQLTDYKEWPVFYNPTVGIFLV